MRFGRMVTHSKCSANDWMRERKKNQWMALTWCLVISYSILRVSSVICMPFCPMFVVSSKPSVSLRCFSLLVKYTEKRKLSHVIWKSNHRFFRAGCSCAGVSGASCNWPTMACLLGEGDCWQYQMVNPGDLLLHVWKWSASSNWWVLQDRLIFSFIWLAKL